MLPFLYVKPRPRRAAVLTPPIGVAASNYFVNRGITAFWLFGFGAPISVIGPYPITQQTGTPSFYAGPRGPEYHGLNSPSTNYWTVKTGAILGGKANWSIVSGARQNGNGGGNAAMIYSERAASGNDIINFGLAGSTAFGKFSLTYRNDGGTLVNPTTGKDIADSKYYVLGGSKSTSAITQYVNGVQDLTNSWSSNDNFTDANIIVNIGNTQQNLSSSGWGSMVHFVCLFPWTLSAADHLNFALDPFQFLVLREDLIASLVGPGAKSFSASIVETVSATDSPDATSSDSATLTETASATDSPDATAQNFVSLTEAAAAADLISTPIQGQMSAKTGGQVLTTFVQPPIKGQATSKTEGYGILGATAPPEQIAIGNELRFPPAISYGAYGGCSGWMTTVIETDDGFEYRRGHWGRSQGKWVVGHNLRTTADYETLLALHRMTQGRFLPIRFQDWTDFTVTAGQGVTILNPDGSIQLAKQYQLTDEISLVTYTDTRPIIKPQPGTLTFSSPSSGVTVDYTTGKISGTGVVAGTTTWTGQFDVPVRFDADESEFSVDKPGAAGFAGGWRSIRLVEVRNAPSLNSRSNPPTVDANAYGATAGIHASVSLDLNGSTLTTTDPLDLILLFLTSNNLFNPTIPSVSTITTTSGLSFYPLQSGSAVSGTQGMFSGLWYCLPNKVLSAEDINVTLVTPASAAMVAIALNQVLLPNFLDTRDSPPVMDISLTTDASVNVSTLAKYTTLVVGAGKGGSPAFNSPNPTSGSYSLNKWTTVTGAIASTLSGVATQSVFYFPTNTPQTAFSITPLLTDLGSVICAAIKS